MVKSSDSKSLQKKRKEKPWKDKNAASRAGATDRAGASGKEKTIVTAGASSSVGQLAGLRQGSSSAC